MQAGSRKAYGKATLDAMCLAAEVHPQAEDSGGYDLESAPVAEELDFLISEDVPSGVVAALLCLSGERGRCLSHALSTVWLQLGVRGVGAVWRITPLLRNVRFASCVSVRRRACFLATTMDRFT